ncbi:hypothetical protein K505DRAFT_301266 [Melanomma pulvis-pyrius CBS 109.77]|uniref:Zn(2)-C6 fungal-type domain-containing protein n=1 Tax=Melanomma pulvis-pyrius CBS 109.77 TaxID=1314802 RepID=A0A6A6XHI5_9PLEO|nr:hypothetical protein K505DRAFT_301266 [Melanomma pulvis-pyrius CBS 109.77]
MPPVASRRGRRIASKACDTCRERKVQCVFDGEITACRRCLDGHTACTFLRERKPRGPVARRHTTPLSLPIGDLTIEHLCPRDTFLVIIEDYLDMVYPLLPLIHRPSFRALLDANAYATDPAFFRLCLALCAVAVASVPRKFDIYGGGRYEDVGAMVDQACRMVIISRITSEREWQNRPSMSTMLVSILLTMASHYAGRPNQGWGYASEAIQFFRALELFRKEGYEKLNILETELCKRAFWVLYIIQIHDRLSFIVPHTGLSFDPVHTDWEFLLPSSVDDEDLTLDTHAPIQHTNGVFGRGDNRQLPLISGFIALVKVFLCVVDLLSNGFPGSPPQAYSMTSGSLRPRVFPEDSIDPSFSKPAPAPSKTTLSLSALLRIIRKLQSTLEELPDELKIYTLDPQLRSPDSYGDIQSSNLYQFDVMRANIHITSLYIQSTILETCSSAFASSPSDTLIASPGDETRSSPGYTPQTQLWKFRESIARELLEVLNFCSSRTLEANGSSMIVKIREIAATLLNDDNDLGVATELEEQSRRYVSQFADILANLDYMGQSAIIPAIFSAH